jgi:hypothetical protein
LLLVPFLIFDNDFDVTVVEVFSKKIVRVSSFANTTTADVSSIDVVLLDGTPSSNEEDVLLLLPKEEARGIEDGVVVADRATNALLLGRCCR